MQNAIGNKRLENLHAYRVMKKNRAPTVDDDFSKAHFSDYKVPRICHYCNEHEKLHDKRRKGRSNVTASEKSCHPLSRGSSLYYDKDEYNQDEVDDAEKRTTTFYKSNIRPRVDSPTTSCLKRRGSRKKSTISKKVNFNEDYCHVKSKAEYHYYDEKGFNSNVHLKKSSYESSQSNSTSYYPVAQHRLHKIKCPNSQSSTGTFKTTSNGDCSSSVNSNFSSEGKFDANMSKLKSSIEDTRDNRNFVKLQYISDPFRKTVTHQHVNHVTNNSMCKSTNRDIMPERKRIKNDPSCSTLSVKSYKGSKSLEISNSQENIKSDTVDTEFSRELINDLHRLSLTSTDTCCSKEIAETNTSIVKEPRIVKAKDNLKRAAVKRMLVYPPEGQCGEPLTLVKKWSNIDCHVRADSKKGFRYKVYYVQKFESDKWYPDEHTGSPFRRLEDADCTTDYG